MNEPSAHEILRALRQNNTSRRRDLITTVYGVILIVVMSSAILLHGVSVSLRSNVVSPGLSLGVMVAGLGMCLRAAVALGPSSLSPPMARWLGMSPVPRAQLTRRRVFGNTILVGLAGCVIGVLSALTGGLSPAHALFLAVGGLVCGWAAAGVALWDQTVTAAAPARRVAIAFVVAGACLSAVASRWPGFVSARIAGVTMVSLGALAIVLCVLAVVRHGRWLARVPLRASREAGATTHAWLDAATSLDIGGITGKAELSRARSKGAFRSRPPGSRNTYIDLVQRQALTLRRRPGLLLVRVLVCGLAWLGNRLFGPTPAAVLLALAGLGMALSLTSMLRTWLGSSALWRMVPADPKHSAWALAVLPLVAVVTAVGAVGAVSGLGRGGLALALAAMVFVLKRHHRPDMQLGEMVDTPFGQFPMGVVTAVSYGSGALVVTLGVGLWFSWPVALVVSALWLVAVASSVEPVGAGRAG